jgi:hypothetical protein
MAKLFESMKEATGVDLADIMKADSFEAQVTRNINLTGAPDIIIGGAAEEADGSADDAGRTAEDAGRSVDHTGRTENDVS